MKWIALEDTPTTNYYSTEDEQKYLKQLLRFFLENGILHRKYYDHRGRALYNQLCVPKYIIKEIFDRIRNSPTGGHLGITRRRTIAEFRKRFYSPNYIEMVAEHICSCSTCLKKEIVQPSHLRTPLQEVSTTTTFPGDRMKIDNLGPFSSSAFKYVLTVIDVFSKNFSRCH